MEDDGRMRIAMFGATGRVGSEVVRRAVQRGYGVTALARDPVALAGIEGIDVVAGGATDPDAVRRALEGADAVVSVMGARTLDPTTDLSEATAGVLAGMRAHGPKRLVLLSHVGVLLSKVDPQYEHVVAEHRRNFEAVAATDLEWIAVCPPGIVSAPASGEVTAVAGKRGPAWSISRDDLAAFLLDQLESDAYLRQAVGVSGPGE